jgi:hypothetical protein
MFSQVSRLRCVQIIPLTIFQLSRCCFRCRRRLDSVSFLLRVALVSTVAVITLATWDAMFVSVSIHMAIQSADIASAPPLSSSLLDAFKSLRVRVGSCAWLRGAREPHAHLHFPCCLFLHGLSLSRLGGPRFYFTLLLA